MHDIDVAVVYEEIHDPNAVLITSKEVHCGFFASAQYLAKKGYPKDINELVLKHRLLTKHDSLLRKVLGEDLFKKASICFKSNNTPALVNALANHTGIGIMPLSFALQGLVCLDNIICDTPVHYYLYANRDTKDIPRVRTMINFYKNIMDKLENPVPIPSMAGEPLPIIRHMANS